MSNYLKISPDYLKSRSDTASFLNSRRRFTRELGKDAQYEAEFNKADDEPARSTGAFRGIRSLNPSPFGTRSLQDFRGVVRNRYDMLANPDVWVNESVMDNRYQVSPQKPNFKRDDPLRAENPDYGKVDDWVYVEQHSSLGKLLEENSDLRESYFDERFSSDYHLSKQISQYVRQRLDFYDPLNDQFLDNHPELAKLIGLDIGSVAEALNQDPELAEEAVAENRQSYTEDICNELASKVAGELEADTKLDEEFFRANPEAAIYLLKNPGQIQWFNMRPSEAEDFKQHYGALKEWVLGEVADLAKSAIEAQGDFVEEYLERNPKFAVDVAGDEVIKEDGSMAENIVLHNLLKDKYTFTDNVYRDHIARRVVDALDDIEGWNFEFLQSHPELAYMVQKSESIASGLRADSYDASRFYSDAGSTGAYRRKIVGAINSFAGGYPLRNETIIDLWA